jgi:hypothetical protein
VEGGRLLPQNGNLSDIFVTMLVVPARLIGQRGNFGAIGAAGVYILCYLLGSETD